MSDSEESIAGRLRPDLAKLKRWTRTLARRAGFVITRARNTPFGVRWEDDVAALGKVNLAVDVGANEGQTVTRLLDGFPSVRIVSYEPVQQAYDVLQRRYRHSRQVTCIRAAVGAECGHARIVDGADSTQNTLLTAAKPHAPTVAVPVTTLAIQAAEHGWHAIDLLKIDTEGFEVEVLTGALPLLERGAVQFILVECEFIRRPNEPHGCFADIVALLEPLDYRVVAFYANAVDGQGWVWGDVLFMHAIEFHARLLTPHTR